MRPRTALRGTSHGRSGAVWRAWHQSPREPARMGAPAPDPGPPVPIDLGAPALMARQKTPAPEAGDIAETIVDVDVSREMEGSFLEYAYSVIYALSLIHISEPTRQAEISYAVFCLKKKK